MSLSAKDRAILNATAADLAETTPTLACLLAEGPRALRDRGITASDVSDLVPGWRPRPWRKRCWQRMRSTFRFRVMRPPDAYR
jgi:hypothetical protein